MSKRLPIALLAAALMGFLTPSVSRAQTHDELTTEIAPSGYPRAWAPGPTRSSIPPGARAGEVQFINWDGGPLELCKAFLSGWPNFNPPHPDYLNVMVNWYRPRTVKYLRAANVNMIFVTFGMGYSIETEQRHRAIVKAYIEECHRQGIHVLTYETLTNIFWEDLFQRVPESRGWLNLGADGNPIHYGAADYSKTGRPTRYLADPSKPGWRDYLKQMVDLSIEAGADGVYYDNCLVSHEKLVDVFGMLVPYALGKKKQFIVMANFHDRDYILHRMLSAAITEDGGEAGIFYTEKVKQPKGAWEATVANRWLLFRNTMRRVEGGYLRNNVGRFRVFENLSEGWKPVASDNAQREVGTRETHLMTGERFQLGMAEAMMFNVANTAAVEGRLAYGLWYDEPEVRRIWEAVGQYNRFFADHKQYYLDTNSLATLAIVLDNESQGIDTLNGLSSHDVLYNVLYEHELTPEKLKPYAAVALLEAKMVRDRAVSALEDYVSSGGKLFVAGASASEDETSAARRRPPWFGRKLGEGQCTYWWRVPAVDELADTLRAADRPPLVKVDAPAGVLYNVKTQPKTGRLLIHLTNYMSHPVGKLTVAIQGKHERIALFTPDASDDKPRILRATDELTKIEVPRLKIYSLLVLEPAR